MDKRSLALRRASGLKHALIYIVYWIHVSRPSQGEWIETSRRPGCYCRGFRLALRRASGLKQILRLRCNGRRGSRPSQGEWIETYWRYQELKAVMSRPSQGEWIETSSLSLIKAPQ